MLDTSTGVATRQGGSAQAARNARKYLASGKRGGGRKARLAVARMSREERAAFRDQGGSILGGSDSEDEDEQVALDEIDLGTSMDVPGDSRTIGGAATASASDSFGDLSGCSTSSRG